MKLAEQSGLAIQPGRHQRQTRLDLRTLWVNQNKQINMSEEPVHTGNASSLNANYDDINAAQCQILGVSGILPYEVESACICQLYSSSA